MNLNLKTGVNFGLISGILVTIGIVVGLVSAGSSKEIIMSAVLVVAFADAFSDSLGIYLSNNNPGEKAGVWQSLSIAFFAKLIVASTFLIPLFLAANKVAMVICVAWSALLLIFVGYYLNLGDEKKNFVATIVKYLIILVLVSLISYYIGNLFKGFYIK